MKKVALVLLNIVSFVYGVNYCDKKWCNRGAHIACNATNEWAKRCPTEVSLVDLSPYIDMILKSHNEKRNLIAGGLLKNFPAASRMASMQWDKELAYFAELNVKKCQDLRHDLCHSTVNYKYSGQNLGLVRYYGYDHTVEHLINDRINNWWDEYKITRVAFLAKYPKNYSGPAIGHFTVMAAEKNVRLGCAALHYMKNEWNNFVMACNYATTNIIDEPIYTSVKAASDCKTGRHPNYPKLCSKSEIYDDL